MKFYFPDSQDMISPTYDFVHDEYSPYRVRQRDDQYAHEALTPRPYDGILVSKAIVDGSVRGAGKYTAAQRERLYRLGVRTFFRLPDGVATLGDCGAFNYADEYEPPYTVDEVLDFYERCGFDAGVSVDHVVFQYDAARTEATADPDWVRRRQVSLRYAEDFLRAGKRRGSRVQPVGAAQGWSPESYADSVLQLHQMGYERIALGGMVPLKSPDIIACLEAIAALDIDRPQLHLLGITRVRDMARFAELGVTSFDSTAPFRQAFMDDRDNYQTADTTYVAVRVPQVDANVALKRRVLAGHVAQREAIAAEQQCLKLLRSYDRGDADLDTVLGALGDYEEVLGVKKSYLGDYARTLGDRPWAACPCSLCAEHGVELVIFRGTERNKRRGFHNLAVFAERVHQLGLSAVTSRSSRG
ncbi:queuine/other tRNA-ribosyltransferase [Planosporangium thailandense]|uniref:Queuine/other tRNA-ribosyltransferase n=1 Tax=Planosporangium thailandense TaxID=765197 RepID=A0ABX0Y0A2_9ACTN|nr:tRNA-guanine transglycosylase DpdA [Planosporangium thailandense]NJC70853.1 queuine/other tRNA-ribosyltransferase [Planosporangium thailandense]